MLKDIPLNQNDDEQINLEMHQATQKYLLFFSLDPENSLCLLMFDIHINVQAKADFLFLMLPTLKHSNLFDIW